jgi:Trk K+ transport system NAD-binding subunit
VVVDKSVDDSDRKKVEMLGCRMIEGDIRDEDVLKQAGVDSAASILIVTGDDTANLQAAITAREHNAKASVVVRLFDQRLARRVESVFDLQALSASFLASPAFVSAATDDSVAAVVNVDGCYLSLQCPSGKSRTKGSSSGIYIRKDGSDISVVDANQVDPDTCLLAIKGERRSDHRRRKKSGTLKNNLQRAAAYLSPVRMIKQLADMWRHSTAITRFIFGALVFIAMVSVVVFWVIGHMKPLDALYFVVTTMTATGFGDVDLHNVSAYLKLYGVLMMLCGAALMATIYTIITDYVLSARVELLLGHREVNYSDHTVIMGLGNVGYRVAHDLKMLGMDIVAVESNQDSDNISAARNMFPVIIGDASRASILEKTGIKRAKVLLAVTDDPMLNLSVALFARESNPLIKTIVRTYDIGLASKIKNFGLDEVLSTSAIASPAFVDVALYRGVQGSFKMNGEDVLVSCHNIDESSPLAEKSVEAISNQMGIAVVLVADTPSSAFRTTTPDTRLTNGQKVVVLLTREKIEKLLLKP